MIRHMIVSLLLIFLASMALGASKPHVISFGKWATVSYSAAEESPAVDMKVRPLYVDGRVKEFTYGLPHDMTDRFFVVQRTFRINDMLPGETVPRWRWERGGWLLVDRVTGHTSSLSLPEFDADSSLVSWYRDYAAYCGVSEDGRKLYVLVVQVGRRKPVLKEPLGEAPEGPGGCSSPSWQRQPVRVTFLPIGKPKSTYAIRGRTVDLISEEEESASE